MLYAVVALFGMLTGLLVSWRLILYCLKVMQEDPTKVTLIKLRDCGHECASHDEFRFVAVTSRLRDSLRADATGMSIPVLHAEMYILGNAVTFHVLDARDVIPVLRNSKKRES